MHCRREGYVLALILCWKKMRILIFSLGNLRSLNDLAAEARAQYIIHTGDFGFYDDHSLDRIAEKYVLRLDLYFHIVFNKSWWQTDILNL